MAHAQNPPSPSSTSADAEAYQQAQHYGHALIQVRTERADMWVESSRIYQKLTEQPYTGSWSSHIKINRLLFEVSNDAEDKKFTRKLLWWRARMITGKFLPAEIMGMILGALYPRSGSESDSESDAESDHMSEAKNGATIRW